MNLNIIKIAVTFAGCFLGAGYVSGQELYQFFISFGIYGFFGLSVAMFLLFAFGVLLMRLSYNSGKISAEELVIRKDNRFLRAFVGIAEVFFLIGIATIMASGVGSLFEQSFGISKVVSSGLFCILLYFLIIGGHERMVTFFSLSVPVLVLMTIIIGIYGFAYYGGASVIKPVLLDNNLSGTGNALINNWFVSALTFVSYNLFSSAEILSPLGNTVSSRRRVCLGIALGTLLLSFTAFSIFLSVCINPLSFNTDMPMLYIAGNMSRFLGIIYAILLLLGMIGTACSSCVAVIHYIVSKKEINRKISSLLSVALCIVVFAFSMFGFGELIGVVYPICGYLGFAVLILMIEHTLYLKHTRKHK